MPDLDDDKIIVNPDPPKPEGDDTPPPGEPLKDDEPSFNKKQMEQLSTLIGRISKKQLEENVLPLIQQRREEVPPERQTDAIKAFNEQLQQKIFEGDVLGAIKMATDVQNNAKETLTRNQLQEVDRKIVSYADRPNYKDIHSDMDKIAKEAIQQGVPPEWAVEHAYHKALATHLSGNRGNDDDMGSLDMVGGGKPQGRRGKEPVLPETFKAACARDIEKGLFKTQREWIDALSPSIRKQHGF